MKRQNFQSGPESRELPGQPGNEQQQERSGRLLAEGNLNDGEKAQEMVARTVEEAVRETAGLFFGRELLEWYHIQKRDLPWRRHRDPYYIWVSEIMLQQTRVDTVIPYFHRFISRFPTVEALADAPEEDVLKCWEGLGYYSRARNLQAAARQVKELHGGKVPDDREAVFGLKGVGPYTAGAILSIAFNRPEPAVDGNVMRVLSRFFLLEDDIAKPSTRVRIERLAASIIPEGEASHFNQALMELGALICTPKSPRCLVCPVMERCEARLAGMETVLPVKTKAKPPRPETRLAALVEGRGANTGRVLIRQRPARGLLARMWELPHVPAAETGAAAMPEAEAMERLRRSLRPDGIFVRPERFWLNAEHTFSHIHWTLQVYACSEEEALPLAAEAPGSYAAREAGDGGLFAAEPFDGGGGDAQPGALRWIGEADMAMYAFPNVFLKLLTAYFAGRAERAGEEAPGPGQGI